MLVSLSRWVSFLLLAATKHSCLTLIGAEGFLWQSTIFAHHPYWSLLTSLNARRSEEIRAMGMYAKWCEMEIGALASCHHASHRRSSCYGEDWATSRWYTTIFKGLMFNFRSKPYILCLQIPFIIIVWHYSLLCYIERYLRQPPFVSSAYWVRM